MIMAVSAATTGLLSACVRWLRMKALVVVLLLLLVPVNSGEVKIQTFTDKGCQNLAENFDIILKTNGVRPGGADQVDQTPSIWMRLVSERGRDTGSGYGSILNVKTFESAIVSIAVDVNSVIACQRGFACNGAGANQISFLGIIGMCATGNPGTQFDKILIT